MIPSARASAIPESRRVALAVGYCFALGGFVFGSWAARLADVKERLDASPGPLGAAMLGTGIGGMIATALGPIAIRRVGSRVVLTVAGSMACVLVVVAAWAPSLLVLAPVLFALGLCGGAMAIAFSAEAVAYEQRAGRPLVNRFHGCHSAGGLLGALVGAAAALALSPLAHLALVAAVALTGLILVARWIPGPVPSAGSAGSPTDAVGRSVLNRRLVTVSAMAWCAAFAETSVIAWSAVHLHEGLHASSAVAALGFAAMAGAMVLVRASGSVILVRWSAPEALRAAGCVAALGAAAIAAAPNAIVGIAGCALLGAGIALVFPTATATSLHSQYEPLRGPRLPSDAFAVAVLIGGTGAQLSGPLLGAVAEVTGLRISFALVAAACVTIAAAARRLPQPGAVPVEPTIEHLAVAA